MVGGGPTLNGVPVVGGAVEFIGTSGDPAAVRREHVDFSDVCLVVKGIVLQRVEGASVVIAEGQIAFLGAGPHFAILSAPYGVEPLPTFTIIFDFAPRFASIGGAFEIVAPHIAHDDGSIAVKGHDILKSLVYLVSSMGFLFQGNPWRVDVVGAEDFSTISCHPQ